ncbi:hypothetical protein Acr_23g0012580 [Actinidia rufa]|uniref:Uncharacterized protein n=1 Tax=Actinidia rufa TaxID=165716 RepID=A0A7J0GQ05_9ERIC|nr:hypothetical protein Acr_23g0012580 [Actinidia rufa]
MVSRSYNDDRGKREAQGEYPLIQRTPNEKETKLLFNAQRAVVGLSGQRPGQSLPVSNENCRDSVIRRIQTKMEEMKLNLMLNNMKIPANIAGEVSSSSERLHLGCLEGQASSVVLRRGIKSGRQSNRGFKQM